MDYLVLLLYNFGVRLGNVYIYAGSFFSDKLKLLYTGRKKSLESIRKFSENSSSNFWIHCASLGEFEQGRPLIEYIKDHFPEKKIVISFFSPSGYEFIKNYPLADLIFYLPSDTDSHNDFIIKTLKPELVIFIKYEFWWNLIGHLVRSDIPVVLVSGIFTPKNYFFKPLFQQFLRALRCYKYIFVQDQQSLEVLKSHHCQNALFTGDTRVDSVLKRASKIVVPERISALVANKKVIIYGSIYPSDMKVVVSVVETFPDIVHIIVPHNISAGNIHVIRQNIKSSTSLYSEEASDLNILIIDNIGMLFSLYSVATYVYVGGGFEKGIHNILEPAVFGVPVFFGPKFKKFIEAISMIQRKSAFEVLEGKDVNRLINHFILHHEAYLEVSQAAKQYFMDNKGATAKIGVCLEHIIPSGS